MEYLPGGTDHAAACATQGHSPQEAHSWCAIGVKSLCRAVQV